MRYLLIIICYLVSLVGYSQTKLNALQVNVGFEEVKVRDVVNKLAASLIAKDTIGMASILDKDFTLTHITGYVQSRTEWLNEVARESMRYYSMEEVSCTISIKENIADVLIRSFVDARIWGSRSTWRLQQKMRLEKRNENWIICYSIASTF